MPKILLIILNQLLKDHFNKLKFFKTFFTVIKHFNYLKFHTIKYLQDLEIIERDKRIKVSKSLYYSRFWSYFKGKRENIFIKISRTYILFNSYFYF